ncbi:hypothetical protein Bca4012_064502 [Brassica carinata]
MFMRWSLTRRRSVQLRGEVQKLSDVKRELSGDVLILTRFGGSYEMSSNNVDGPYRGSYGGTDGLLAEERHIDILGHFLYTAKLVAKQEGLDDRSIGVSHSCSSHWRTPNELASWLVIVILLTRETVLSLPLK